MNTQELVGAASTIASGMVAAQYAKGATLASENITEIARIAIEVARQIETEARKRY
jgi:hypothetical protein